MTYKVKVSMVHNRTHHMVIEVPDSEIIGVYDYLVKWFKEEFKEPITIIKYNRCE